MNKIRREELNNLINEILDIKDRVEGLKDEEESCYDNLPESFQYGEKGERMQERINSLEMCLDSLDDAYQYIEEAIE